MIERTAARIHDERDSKGDYKPGGASDETAERDKYGSQEPQQKGRSGKVQGHERPLRTLARSVAALANELW